MPSFEEARVLIMQDVRTLSEERVSLLGSRGRTLSQDIFAPWNLPSCSNSAMDGYAVRASDCNRGGLLTVIDYVPAGACAGKSLELQTAIRIMTGAPIPDGADSVVPLEHVAETERGVVVQHKVAPGQNVRFAGEDIREGDLVLARGTPIQAKEIGVLASLGFTQVPLYRRPTVAILATGDELLEAGEIPQHGKIINSNSYFLAAAVEAIGGVPILLGIADDNVESHREKLSLGLNADVLITSAGVSVGDRDLVRNVLTELGVQEIFWRVEVKPGRSFAYGIKGETRVFALPGNPVATVLTFEEFVVPALLKMMGHQIIVGQNFEAELQHEMPKPDVRTRLVRMRVEIRNGRYVALSAGKQDTGSVKSLLNANAIAVIPPEQDVLGPGDLVTIHFFNSDTHRR